MIETTDRVLSERRVSTLREFATAVATARTTERACQLVEKIVRQNPHDLPFTLLYLLDEAGKVARLTGHSGKEALASSSRFLPNRGGRHSITSPETRARSGRYAARQGNVMQHSIEQLQLIIESACDFAIIRIDTHRRVTLWNVGAERFLGWQTAEIMGQSADIFFTPEDRAAGVPEKEAQRAREEGRAENERWHVRKDGSRFWASGLAQPVYDENQTLQGYIQIFRDMTERRQAEELLRESQVRLQLALDASALGTFVWYVQEDRAEWDAQMWALFSPSTDAPLSLPTALSMIHPDDRDRYALAVAKAIDTSGPGRHKSEIRVIHSDGTEHWLAITGQTVFGDDPPRPLRMNGIAADITERKRREANLTFLADLQKILISFSSVAEIQRIAGKRIAEYLHLTHCLFVDIHQTAGIAEVVYDQNADGFPSLVGSYRLEEFHTEAERQTLAAGQSIVVADVRDGERAPEAAERFEALGIRSLVNASYIRDGQWKFVLSAMHDHPYDWHPEEADLLCELAERIYLRIERARAEDALRQHQVEIETLNARLQRAIQETHHRVKNNLQVIAALVEINGYGTEPASERSLRRINTHVRALATIHELLTHQAKGDAYLNDINVRAMLARLIPILQTIAEGRRIRYEADVIPLPVQQSAALALLVNELVSNAIKHGEGDVTITLRLFEEHNLNREQQGARWVRLEVCDEGSGFPEDFDPRKAANTGLELIDSTGRWDLRGEVSYENRTEGGARVVVAFPVVTK